MLPKKAPPGRGGLGNSKPVKVLVIRSQRDAPKLPDNFEHDTWAKLAAAVSAIHLSQPVDFSLEVLYKAVEDLCSCGLAANLYTRLQEAVSSHIRSVISSLLLYTSDGAMFLDEVNRVWQSHCNHMTLIQHIFLVLDRTYVLQSTDAALSRSLWDMGLQLFRRHLLSIGAPIYQKTQRTLLLLIEAERRGEVVDRSLLKSLLRAFVSLALYAEEFEQRFLDVSAEFYAREAAEKLQELETGEYLQHVERRQQEEADRLLHYLDVSTRKPLLALVEFHLLTRHVNTILGKGFDSLVAADRLSDLKRLYTLLSRAHALPQVRIAWNSHIKAVGTALVQDEEKDATQVLELLLLRKRLAAVLQTSFAGNVTFANSLKEAFEAFINSRPNKPAELLAKFLDSKMRTGNKAQSEEDLETTFDRALVLFRYIQGKDIFEAFYKKDLAKRLLLAKSADFDSEKSLIARLKSECGSTFTSKLEGMFKDMELSADLAAAFRQSPQAQQARADTDTECGPAIELHVHVLTQGFWPLYPPSEANLPPQLARLQDQFRAFYLSRHSGRKLTWQNALGHCVLRAFFDSGKKELSVSLQQAVVLLLFNSPLAARGLSFNDIKATTALDEKVLRRTLQSLSCGKVRVLLKSPAGAQVDDSDSFAFASNFRSKMFRLKINQIQSKETVEENKKTSETVLHDRQYQIDAAIVRIMKTKKTLTHTLLLSELYSQLKFPLKPADLKKRIESLIDREYLRRDASNASLYEYLA